MKTTKKRADTLAPGDIVITNGREYLVANIHEDDRFGEMRYSLTLEPHRDFIGWLNAHDLVTVKE